MLCPRDGATLTATKDVVGPRTSAQVCPKCAGVMLDWKTTQALFTQLGVSVADLQSLVASSAAKQRKTAPLPCVSCGKGTMRPFAYKNLELDLCEECGACWFDRDELARVSKGRFGGQLKQAGTAPDETSSVEGVFEMFWDCAFCDAKALLGQTHRFCPKCGAPQDATRRYFPPEGQEVKANTTFDGADRTCPACQTPNGAKANNCRSCGSPLDGSAEVGKVADRSSAAPKTPQKASAGAPASSKRPWVAIIGGTVGALLLLCLLGALCSKKDMQVTVVEHRWTRAIEVEELRAVSDSAWCDSMPSGAYAVSRTRDQRSTKKVPDGEDCSTRDVDRGNGTFERRKECHPRFKEEPVYDERCHYTIDRWTHGRTEEAKGRGVDEEPYWPELRLTRRGNGLGAEREGSRHETYTLDLKGADGKRYECSINSLKWKAVADGVSRTIKVGLMGSTDCDNL